MIRDPLPSGPVATRSPASPARSATSFRARTCTALSFSGKAMPDPLAVRASPASSDWNAWK